MDLAEYASIRPEWETAREGRQYEKVEIGQVRFVFHSSVRDRFGCRPGTADLSLLNPEQYEVLRRHFAAEAITLDLSKLTPEQIDALVDATFSIKGDE